jgi:hypothetical protein
LPAQSSQEQLDNFVIGQTVEPRLKEAFPRPLTMTQMCDV